MPPWTSSCPSPTPLGPIRTTHTHTLTIFTFSPCSYGKKHGLRTVTELPGEAHIFVSRGAPISLSFYSFSDEHTGLSAQGRRYPYNQFLWTLDLLKARKCTFSARIWVYWFSSEIPTSDIAKNKTQDDLLEAGSLLILSPTSYHS